MNVEFVMSLFGTGQTLAAAEQDHAYSTLPAEDGGAAGLAAFPVEP